MRQIYSICYQKTKIFFFERLKILRLKKEHTQRIHLESKQHTNTKNNIMEVK